MCITETGTLLGKTGSAEYYLRGIWVYRRAGSFVQKYDTLPGFCAEWDSGAFGGSWRDTPTGKRLIDQELDLAYSKAS